jgi:hypothetical protein
MVTVVAGAGVVPHDPKAGTVSTKTLLLAKVSGTATRPLPDAMPSE